MHAAPAVTVSALGRAVLCSRCLMTRRAWLLHLAVVAGYAGVAVAFTWPLALRLWTHLPGDPGGDTGVYVWNQWVFRQEALVARASPLSTDRIVALSRRVSLAPHNYTEFLNVLALPLLPHLGVVATFNVIYLLISVLTAYSTYLLAWRVSGSRTGAWLAGLAFAWSPILVARSTAHMSLVAAAPLPVFLLALLRADRTGRARDAALCGLAVAWAAFCDVYYAVCCVLIAAGYMAASALNVTRAARVRRPAMARLLDVAIVVLAGLVAGLLFGRGGQIEVLGVAVTLRGLYTPVLLLTLAVVARAIVAWGPRLGVRRDGWPRLARIGAAAALAGAVPLAPVLVALGRQALEGDVLTPPTFWRSSPPGVDLLAFFTPNPNHPLVRRAGGDWFGMSPTAFAEYTAALPLAGLGVLGAAVWRAGFRAPAPWVWLGGGFALLALGPFVHVAGHNTFVPGPWALLRYLPIVGAARSPSRFAVLAALGAAVLLAGAVAAMERRWPARRMTAVLLVAAALMCELWPAPRPLFAATVPGFYDLVAADPRPVRVLELPVGFRDGTMSVGDYSARSQFHQTRHGKPLIGGYLSRLSPREIRRLREARPTLDALLTLSEGGTLPAERLAVLVVRGAGFIERAQVGYVVIDHSRAPRDLERFAQRAFALQPIAHEWPYTLYRPRTDVRAAEW